MDANLLGEDVQNINVLTVVANESYGSFAKGLQTELAEAVADRPRMVTVELFRDKVIKDAAGAEQVVDFDLALNIYEGLITSGYVKKGVLTDKYYEDKNFEIAEEAADFKDSVMAILDSVYDSRAMQPEDARKNNIELKVDESKLGLPEFRKLWANINARSAYVVEFDQEELNQKAISALNLELRVSKILIKVETGTLGDIESREQLQQGAAFVKDANEVYKAEVASNAAVKYDLVGKVVCETAARLSS